MVSRRAVLQGQAEKVSRNWVEESGMRQFIAVSGFPMTRARQESESFCVESYFLGTRGVR